ncbi:hypothetical protein JTB14_020159 [Gonioctena quinquepunctata]|nr:hypothetical protein JTB14_020159 [Gonioctena quinquepunctata]
MTFRMEGKLNKRLSKSQEGKTIQVPQQEQMGDVKPSHFLQRLEPPFQTRCYGPYGREACPQKLKPLHSETGNKYGTSYGAPRCYGDANEQHRAEHTTIQLTPATLQLTPATLEDTSTFSISAATIQALLINLLRNNVEGNIPVDWTPGKHSF